jgi:hypothetical protein
VHWKQHQRVNEVEGPWGQEDLYSNRICSRRRLGEGSLFTRDKGSDYQGEVNRNKRRCQIERCRSCTGLEGFGSLVKYVKPDVILFGPVVD